MNTNTEYELFTQEVYQLLATYKGFESSSVQHNVKLKGKSGLEHQIDVYWEYKKDGIGHRVAIECKNYSYGVSIGKVRDFYGVISDLENVKGIMVTTVGYQKGAKQYADFYGISLKELRAPKDEETIIGELDIKWDINGTHQLFLVDEEWASKHKFDMASYRERLNFCRIKRDNKWSEYNHLPLNIVDELIRDKNGKVITSIDEIKKRSPDKRPNNNTVIYCLENSYVQMKYWGLVKINEVMFEDEHTVEENTVISKYIFDIFSQSCFDTSVVLFATHMS
jgi:hypothetical protein